MLFFCTAILCCAFIAPKYTKAATLKNANDYQIGELTLTNYDSSTDKVFDGSKLSDLYAALTGVSGATLQTVANSLTGTMSSTYGYTVKVNLPTYKTAADLFVLNGNKNIVVNLGGQEFAVSFLTTDTNGHVIATLWMTQPLKNSSGTAVTDKFGWATVAYNTNYTTTIGESYISNAYSTSKLRMAVLNAGPASGGDTQYAMGSSNANITSLNQTVTDAERKANMLAPFTLDNTALAGTSYANKSLINYITTPAEVEYTYYVEWPYASGSNAGTSYILNEALTSPMRLSTSVGTTNTNFYPNNQGAHAGAWWNAGLYNYATSTVNHYNDWGADYVWLPALSETGYSSVDGLWATGKTTTGQIKFNSENVSDSSTLAGTTVSAERVWLRSGHLGYPYLSRFLSSSGGFYDAFAAASLAVRPALHLNLTKADAATKTPVTTPQGATVKTEYNGAAQSLKTLETKPVWYNQSIYTDTTALTLSQSTFTEAGTYTVTAELLSEDYVWSDSATDSSAQRTFTFIVEKKKLSIEFEEDDNGYQIAKFLDEGEIYSRDTGENYPKLITKYYEEGDSPNSAVASPTGFGEWIALAVLENADSCNYCVDATQQFTVSKKQIAYPVITSEKSATYSGSALAFQFSGFDSEIMTYTVPDGADSFDGTTLKATNAGSYTVKYTLKNPDLYEWTGTAPEAVIINAKAINLLCNDLPESWAKGEEFTFTVTASVNDENLALAVKCDRGGIVTTLSSKNNGDGTHTVTVPATLARGSYTLTVSAPENGNYTASLEKSFEVTAQGLDLDESELVWIIGGKSYNFNDLNADGVLEIEYSGASLTPKVDDFSLADFKIESYGGTTSATDVGDYEVTVHIVANSDEFAFDETFTLKYKIVPKAIAFENVVWEYSNDGENWVKMTSMPSFTNNDIKVRISPDYLSGLGLKEGDYTINYNYTDSANEQGEHKTQAMLTITTANYTAANGANYANLSLDWEITAKALKYDWSGTQTVEVGDNAFEFPAVVFEDGKDYSDYFAYVYTVGGVEYSAEEIKNYIAENWSESTPVSGTVSIRLKDNVTEVNINEIPYLFSTGAPKTPITVSLSGGGEYGKVEFNFTVTRGGNDERQRTEVTVSGETIEAQTFDGSSSELTDFVRGLGAGEYVITVSLKAGNDSYALSDSVFALVISKCKVELPALQQIIFNGDTQSLENFLNGFNGSLMTLDGIVSGRDSGSYTATISLIDSSNYEFVKTTENDGGETPVRFALTAETVEALGSEYEYNWTIEKFVITEDMWDMSGKNGASIKLPSQFNALLADENLLKITYSYFTEQNGDALDSVQFKGGNSFYVSATLSGEDKDNFEFENRTLTSDKTVYTVPQSAAAAFLNKALDVVKNNLALVIGCAVGLLLLILLIIIIAVAVKKKKKREAERKEEQRLEREERMMRMQLGGAAMGQMPITAAGMMAAQQAQPVQQVQPQMPVQQPVQPVQPYQPPVQAQQSVQQPYDGGAMARIEAELAAIREEQKNKIEAELANARLLVEFERLRGDVKQLGGAVNFNGQQNGVHNTAIPADVVIALLEAVKNSGNVTPVNITAAPQPAAAIPQSVEESAPVSVSTPTVYPADAVITTTTTVDTTQKQPRKTERENKRERTTREVDGGFADVDGFYDEI